MGNAAIWYYPDPLGAVEKIDFGTPTEYGFTDLQEVPVVDAATARAQSGARTTTVRSRLLRMRFVLERFSGLASAGQDLARHLLSLQAHLERGGTIGVALDEDKAWASVTTATSLARGTSGILTKGPGWYNTAATLAANDELVMQSEPPEGVREWVKLSSVSASGKTLTLSAGCRYTYGTRVLIRHRGFHPALKLADVARPFITHEHRLAYTLDLTLDEDEYTYTTGMDMILRGTTPTQTKWSPDQGATETSFVESIIPSVSNIRGLGT